MSRGERNDDTFEQDNKELEDEYEREDDELDDDDEDDDEDEDEDDDISSDSRDEDDDEDDDSSSSDRQEVGRRRGRGRGRGRSSDDAKSEDGDDDLNSGSKRRTGGDDSRDPIIEGGSRKGYTFLLDEAGLISELRRVRPGRSRLERIEDGESWLFKPSTTGSGSGELVKTETYTTGTEVSTYTDANNDGIFTRISETFIPFSSASNPPGPII